MPPLKHHNEYLDANSESESDVARSDSEEELLADSRTAGLGTHRAKRLKRTEVDETEDIDSDDEPVDNSPPSTQAPTESLSGHKSSRSAKTPLPESKPDNKSPVSTKKRSKPGILYLSRIPPYMPPHKVHHHLSPFGTIANLFLTPEPPARRHARLAAHPTANKKKTYVDGWVEFAHRRHAKACVAAINGNLVGGKKGGWFRDDVWSVRYLKGFQWGDLMEGVRREEREREERVRVGVRKDKKETEAFLRGVEGARVERGKRERMEKRRKQGGGLEQREGEPAEQRTFRQSEVLRMGEGGPDQPEDVRRVLSKIF